MSLSLDDVPDQSGKNIIITGASSGIGLECSRMLAKKGGHVVMACRNVEKAQPLADAINTDAAAAGGKATVLRMDTTDLDSIDAFAKDLTIERVDSLLLNAGIMAVPYREIATRSEKHPKMESQMTCNVVGHFYLAHVLTPLLKSSPGARVVTVSSLAADYSSKKDSINYDIFTCQTPTKYNADNAYIESKLGDLLLAHELGKRCKSADMDVSVVASHPGFSKTPLLGKATTFLLKAFDILMSWNSHSSEAGGLVIAVAATYPTEKLPENAYFGPSGLWAYKGDPTAAARMSVQGRDGEQSKKLWEMCEELCGVKTI